MSEPGDLRPLRLGCAITHQFVCELREAVDAADAHPGATDALRLRARTALGEAEALATRLDAALLILTTLGVSEA